VRLQWAEALRDGTPLELELPLRGRAGNYHPFLTRAIPLRDSSAKSYRWIGTHIDISEQKRREEHIRFIIEEMSHRTKNLLAVVMAVASQTARHADSVTQYHERFLNRLGALAHCHDLLVKDSWQGASFDDVVMSQMRPFSEAHSGRINAAGPHVILKPDAVQNLGLAFHELATNASKHGALSGPRGDVLVHWQVDPAEDRVRVQWREMHGPPVTPPLRRGFGHVVIEQIVPRALNGNGKLDFAPDGVNWTFEFPNRNA
jgi:two-component sensor histidine kinase